MNKLFGLLVCSALALVGCNEAKAEKASEQVAKPVATTPVATPAPAPAAPAAEAPAKIVNVEWADALKMSAAGALLVDVRTPGEVAEGMAEGAVNIPLQEIPQRLAEFPKDKDLLIYCRSGKRSMAASNFLVENGYTRVFNVVGGFLAFPKN